MASDPFFNPLINCLTPAEGERLVKNYHCTCLKSKLLGLEVDGNLSVTNRRVIFYAMGFSGEVKSVLDSEVPIEDVSGINCYKGHYLSILHLLGGLLASIFITGFLNTLIGMFQLITIFKNPNLDSQAVFNLVAFVAAVLSLAMPPNKIFRPVLAALAATLFAETGGLSLLSNIGRDILMGGASTSIVSGIDMIFALVLGIYALIAIFRYAQRETISLAISSKGGSYTPISIAGISSFSLSNTAAFKALTADPAEDADSLLKELGALILDMRTLGDEGIPKWNKFASQPVPPVPALDNVN